MPSQFSTLAFMALTSSALAYPYKPSGGYAYPTGTGGAPFVIGNHTRPHGTGYYPTGTGLPTDITSTISLTSTVVQTVVLTVSAVPYSASAAAVSAADVGAASGSGACSSRQTLTQTVTDRVTVTVTPSEVAAAAASTKSSVCTKKTKSSSDVSEATPSSYAAPTTSSVSPSSFVLYSSVQAEVASTVAPSSSSSAAPSSSSTTPAAAYSSAAASSVAAAAASTSSSSSSTGTGKRGVAYNDASLTEAFVGKSKFSWGYNWGQVSSGLPSNFEYVAMIWGTGSSFTSSWFANAKSAIASGTKHLLAFNEPDLKAQANLTPAAAATGYMTYMQPFKTSNPDVRLGSPAVTNGADSDGMGIGWLCSFITACSSCTIDFVNIHWYDSASNVDYFKAHVKEAHDRTGKPVWVTEFGATGTDAEISTFLEEVMSWMDSQDYVERYSYFMVKDGTLVNGNSLTSYGQTYATS